MLAIEPPEPPVPSHRARNADPDRRAVAAERRRLLHDLKLAMAEDGLILHYQPRLALDSHTMVGAEALLRWPHRKRGLIAPAAFVPLAEETGLITEIGGWVLCAACWEAMAWPDVAVVSVNVSARQLHQGGLIRQVARALEESHLPPDRLGLELTESMLIDLDEDALLTLGAARDLGVGLALDDFGTGYASLGMLRRLPLTTLKLDRSLVRSVPHATEDSEIARAVVATGRALGLMVVAEGIETEPQRAFLTEIGAGEGQGYLFSRPVPAPDLRALGSRLTQWGWRRPTR